MLEINPQISASEASSAICISMPERSVFSEGQLWRERSVWDNSTAVLIEFVPSVSAKAATFISKLNSYKELGANWDSYGALPPEVDVIEQAIELIKKADRNSLPLYFVAPGPNGEVVVEFKKGEKEAAIYFTAGDSTELILHRGNENILEGTVEKNYSELLEFING